MELASSLHTPLLITCWRRPQHLQRLLRQLSNHRPASLYLFCDGFVEKDIETNNLVGEVRNTFHSYVDWKCNIHTLFPPVNHGCQKGVTLALNWFFSNVDRGIVLEDDCSILPGFLEYCTELLKLYSSNHHISTISASNFVKPPSYLKSSYYFSRYTHCWGWASWARAWEEYDHELTLFNTLGKDGILRFFENKREGTYWYNLFRKAYLTKEVSSWALPRFLSSLYYQRLAILPSGSSLVVNDGYGTGSTHHKRGSSHLYISPNTIQSPLIHPSQLLREANIDTLYFENLLSKSPVRRLSRKVRTL